MHLTGLPERSTRGYSHILFVTIAAAADYQLLNLNLIRKILLTCKRFTKYLSRNYYTLIIPRAGYGLYRTPKAKLRRRRRRRRFLLFTINLDTNDNFIILTKKGNSPTKVVFAAALLFERAKNTNTHSNAYKRAFN